MVVAVPAVTQIEPLPATGDAGEQRVVLGDVVVAVMQVERTIVADVMRSTRAECELALEAAAAECAVDEVRAGLEPPVARPPDVQCAEPELGLVEVICVGVRNA